MKLPELRDANVLHARIPEPRRPMPRLEQGAAKYRGEIAKGYDAKREDSEKWKREDEIVRAWLTELAPKSVLDVPVGTGRFIPLYRELAIPHALGVDLSSDMLREASAKVGDGNVFLQIGDARDLGDIGTFDVAICCRLMRWLETNEMQLKVISELMRVATKAVIFNVRVDTGPLPLPHDAVDALLSERGWKVVDDETIVEDFTFFRLEPIAQSDRIDEPMSSTDKLGVKT
jgi:ubiquinone/menaquinone biosynthesis C-methylase UbiE